jgi:hypothetical protein
MADLIYSRVPADRFLLVALVVLGACGGNASTAGTGGRGGAPGSGGAVSSGGMTGSGGAPASGGSVGSGGSVVGPGGAPSTGGVTSVSTGGATASSGGATGTAGRGSGGTASGGRVGSGGASATGGASVPGTGGAGGGNATACTRDFLKNTVDTYFKALAAHSASTLPLADNVKFTENAKAMKVGEDGLWKTAGTLKYAHSAIDTDVCAAASEAVVPDGTTDIPFALRLKIQNQKITEIETIAARAGDYKVSGSSFASNTGAIIASATSVKWDSVVPVAQRNTREELIAWMEKYFKIFPRGVCNTDTTCKRLENGGGSFDCNAGASCTAGPPGSGTPAIAYHAIFADVETGIGVGFDLFMGNTDMHIFKMYGGKVYAVHAILGGATTTGWD